MLAKCPSCKYWLNVGWLSVGWLSVRWLNVRWLNFPAETNLRVFRLHLSVLLPCGRWWRFHKHSIIEAVPNKRQPGDSPRNANQADIDFEPNNL